MFVNRRSLLTSAAAFAAIAATGARAQSNWPSQPLRIIVPYPAGGSTDVLIRILGEKMKDMLGQPIVVENRPGAGGNLGIAAVAQSRPDGYTLGAATVGHFAINQFLYSKMPFDPEKDIVSASLTWELPNVFVVPADHVPAKSVQEFIAWAKQKGRVSYGSPGVGTSPHLSGVMFVQRNKLDAVHVPFRGAAQTIPAMLAGDVNFAIDNLASYVASIDSGKMRALAVTSAQRWPTMQSVPTMGEADVPNFVVTSWASLVVPAGTPKPIIDKLSATIKQLAADKDIQQRFLVAGARALSSTPQEALAYANKERAMWKDIVAASGAKAD